MFPSIFHDFFDRDLFDLTNTSFMNSTLPAVNIHESKDEYLVEVAAPGMNKEDFKIELENNFLVVSSEKEEKKEEEGKEYTRKEFSYQSFKRSFSLPKTIEESKIQATYKDGVLKISLPKKEETKEMPKKLISIG
jgi:HSP20 family protein